MYVRAQTSALGIAIRFGPSEKERKAGERVKVEITNRLCAGKDQQPQLSLVEFQATEGSFRQPSAAEVLTFCKLRYARSRAQELSNEFARLLNRGSSLE
jgi:hypothetical protein